MFFTIPFHVIEQAILPFFDAARLRAFSRTSRLSREAVKSHLWREYGIDEEKEKFLQNLKKNISVEQYCRRDHAGIVQFLVQREGRRARLSDLKVAAEHGCDSVCSFLVHCELFQPLLSSIKLDLMEDVAGKCSVSTMKKLMLYREPSSKCVVRAAKANNLEMVRLLISHLQFATPKAAKQAILHKSCEMLRVIVLNDGELDRDVVEAAANHGEKILSVLFETVPSRKIRRMILVNAARCGYLSIVSKMLEQGLEAQQVDWNRAFSDACASGSLEIAQLLAPYTHVIACKECVREVCKNGYEEILDFLFSFGLSMESDDLEGELALKNASKEGHINIVQKLLNSGISAKRDRSECLALACQQGHIEIARLLLSAGAEVNRNKGSPLARAARGGYKEIINLLLQHGAAFCSGDCNPLTEAVQSNQTEIARDFLRSGIGCWGMPHPIYPAVKQGNIEIVRQLLERFSDPSTNMLYDSTLGDAVKNEDYEMVSLLLERVYYPSEVRHTALAMAVVRGCKDVAELILFKVSVPNFNDNDRRVKRAVKYGYYETLRVLLRYGHMSVVTAQLSVAARKNCLESVRFLLNTEQCTEQNKIDALDEAARAGNMQMCNLLVEHGADLRKTRHATLRIVIERDYYEIARMLLDKAGDLEESQLRGMFNEASSRLVKLLLSRFSCSSCLLNELLETAINKGKYQVANLLLRSGALITSFEPLESCARLGNYELLKTLLRKFSASSEKKNKLVRTAIKKRNLKVLKVVMEEGGEIEVGDLAELRSVDVNTPEFRSISGKIGEICLQCNARVRNREGLKVAAATGNKKLLKRLLRRKGANVHTRNEQALRTAAEFGKRHLVRLLLGKDTDEQSIVTHDREIAYLQAPPVPATSSASTERSFSKLSAADLHAKQEEALRKASANGHVGVVKDLLHFGAKVSAENYGALKSAVKSNSSRVVSVLLESKTVPLKVKNELAINAAWYHNRETLEVLRKYL